MNILFFGSLHEQLGMAELALPNSNASTVGELRQELQQSHPDWQIPLSDNNVLFAVNKTMADETSPIASGDEIAFFPPVTGG